MRQNRPHSLPTDIQTAVKTWLQKRSLPGDEDKFWEAIATLAAEGCSRTDIVDVLELLWCYNQTDRYKSAKRNRDWQVEFAEDVIKRFENDANDAQRVAQMFGISSPNQPTTPIPSNREQQSRGKEADDSDDDSNMPPPPPPLPTVDSSGNEIFLTEAELEIWDRMREWADNLKSYLSLITDDRLPFAAPFGRPAAGVTGTTPFLVLAAALVEVATGSPHYKEVATIIETICSHQQLETEAAIQKKVANFKERNENKDSFQEWLKVKPESEMVSESERQQREEERKKNVREAVREWLRSLNRSQS